MVRNGGAMTGYATVISLVRNKNWVARQAALFWPRAVFAADDNDGAVSWLSLIHISERKVNRTADLDAALAFVIGRIEEEATRSDEPLSDEQCFLLNHLPKVSALPQADGADPESPMLLLPRDIEYERLCGLAKAAHRNDLRLNPALVIDWDFAAAVSKLNGHPMSWLQQWAGVKVRRPLWDFWLLISAALLLISCLLYTSRCV